MTWRVVKNPMRDDGYFVVVEGPQTYYKGLIDEDGQPIPELPHAILPGQLARDDAYVVSAAYELLRACKDIKKRFDEEGTYDWALDAAIAKAEGR